MLLQKGSASNAMPVVQKLCLQCLSAAAVFALPAWQQGGLLPVPNAGFVGGVLWLVLVATFGAWGLYYLALRQRSAARVTAILYLSPPVTMVWAWLMFDEPLSWAMAVGLVLSLCGIVAREGHALTPRRAQPQASWKGSSRGVLPVSRAIALAKAGASGGSPDSPMPVGASALGTMCTAMRGMSGMRATT